jgi:hypothetical protein
VQVFVRDDDAGWEDGRLLALLDVTQRAGVAIDLAAIPAALGPALAAELCARIDGAPWLVAVHQHGLQHLNHEPVGRKCEFGAGAQRQPRSARTWRRAGRRSPAWLGERLQPWFTPPWNRCGARRRRSAGEPRLPGALARPPRQRRASSALPELPVDIDWCQAVARGAGQRGGRRAGRCAARPRAPTARRWA